jgi:hypothetical protein
VRNVNGKYFHESNLEHDRLLASNSEFLTQHNSPAVNMEFFVIVDESIKEYSTINGVIGFPRNLDEACH